MVESGQDNELNDFFFSHLIMHETDNHLLVLKIIWCLPVTFAGTIGRLLDSEAMIYRLPDMCAALSGRLLDVLHPHM